jgi:8-amino-3,8-dideoxy-alpha-D-manno-octulosonate transaminase
MTTGEGGLVATDDQRLWARSFAAHDLGYVRSSAGRLGLEDTDTQSWGVGGRMNELVAAVGRVQLAKLDTIVGNMRAAKNRIKDALKDIQGLEFRRVIDPEGDGGSFLYVTFPDREVSLKFVKAIQAEGVCGSEGGMYPVHMDNWGFHIYHHIPGLVNKVAVGDVSVWDLAENAGSKDVSYAKGTCPVMDERAERSMVMCIPSKLTAQDVQDIITGFKKVAAHLL